MERVRRIPPAERASPTPSRARRPRSSHDPHEVGTEGLEPSRRRLWAGPAPSSLRWQDVQESNLPKAVLETAAAPCDLRPMVFPMNSLHKAAHTSQSPPKSGAYCLARRDVKEQSVWCSGLRDESRAPPDHSRRTCRSYLPSVLARTLTIRLCADAAWRSDAAYFFDTTVCDTPASRRSAAHATQQT